MRVVAFASPERLINETARKDCRVAKTRSTTVDLGLPQGGRKVHQLTILTDSILRFQSLAANAVMLNQLKRGRPSAYCEREDAHEILVLLIVLEEVADREQRVLAHC